MSDQPKADDTEDRPIDIKSITVNEYTAGKIKSNLFSGSIDSYDNDDVEFGIQVHRDGADIALSAGTTWTPEDAPELHTYHGLTPEEAREIASALEEAAEKSEELKNKESQPEADAKSFLQRLMP